MLREIARRYRTYYAQQEFRTSVLFSLLAFFAAIYVNNFGTHYSTRQASNFVEDIVLSNTPVFDIDFFLVYGAAALVLFVFVLLLVEPRRTPFTLYALALFYFTRGIFISLTHIGPFPVQTPLDFTSNLGIFLSKIFFGGGDLFFSGHTGAPFLLALLYWHEKTLRYIFLGSSIFFGITVLLGHVHYSIDVASAFFISFGIYHIAMWLFPYDHAIFLSKR